MKHLISLALALVALPVMAIEEVSPIVIGSAAGPSSGSSAQATALTNAVPASTTESTLVGNGVDVRGWRSIAIQFKATSSANAAGTTTLTFARSLSNTSTDGDAEYETAATRFTWVLTLATGANVVVTNLPLDATSGISRLKLVSVAQGTNALTSVSMTVNRKRDQ